MLPNAGIAAWWNGSSSLPVLNCVGTASCVVSTVGRYLLNLFANSIKQLGQDFTVADVVGAHHCRQNLLRCFNLSPHVTFAMSIVCLPCGARTFHSPSPSTFTPVESTTTCTPLTLGTTGNSTDNFPNRRDKVVFSGTALINTHPGK